MVVSLLLLVMTPVAAANAGTASPPVSIQQAFEIAAIDWASCEGPRTQEMARRLGRAGPGGKPDLDSLGNCAAQETRLAAAIHALPAGAARDKANADVEGMRKAFEAQMKDIYDRNNHE